MNAPTRGGRKRHGFAARGEALGFCAVWTADGDGGDERGDEPRHASRPSSAPRPRRRRRGRDRHSDEVLNPTARPMTRSPSGSPSGQGSEPAMPTFRDEGCRGPPRRARRARRRGRAACQRTNGARPHGAGRANTTIAALNACAATCVATAALARPRSAASADAKCVAPRAPSRRAMGPCFSCASAYGRRVATSAGGAKSAAASAGRPNHARGFPETTALAAPRSAGAASVSANDFAETRTPEAYDARRDAPPSANDDARGSSGAACGAPKARESIAKPSRK